MVWKRLLLEDAETVLTPLKEMEDCTPFTLEVRVLVLVVVEIERVLVVVDCRPRSEVVANIPFTLVESTPPA